MIPCYPKQHHLQFCLVNPLPCFLRSTLSKETCLTTPNQNYIPLIKKGLKLLMLAIKQNKETKKKFSCTLKSDDLEFQQYSSSFFLVSPLQSSEFNSTPFISKKKEKKLKELKNFFLGIKYHLHKSILIQIT